MVGAIIQTRMSSTRLRGKVLLPLSGEPMLFHIVERLKCAKRLDTVVVATTTDVEDDVIEEFCTSRGYSCFRGSRDDVLSRYAGAAEKYGIDTIVRITADCPLIDPITIDQILEAFRSYPCDYISNILPDDRTYPRGLDAEVFSYSAIERANTEATEPHEREHVTPYIWENKKKIFKLGPQILAQGIYTHLHRLTVDYQEDYELLQRLYDTFYTPGKIISAPDVIAYLDAHPELASINAFHEQEYPRQGIRR